MQKTQTTLELKSLAKAVTASLKRQGHDVPHSAVLHAMASAANVRDWHKLLARQEAQAATQAPDSFDLVEFLGASVDGVLSWQGWNVPATLDLRTARLDAGDFAPEHAVLNGAFRAKFPKLGQVDFSGVRFVPKEPSGEPQSHWDVPQRPWEAFIERARKASLAPALQGPEVAANFWTDDRAFEVSFDARAYLQQASDADLRSILEVDCSGDYSTDAVAEHMRDENLQEDIVQAFNYLSARNQNRRDTIGFEVELDKASFYRWLDEQRPQVLAGYLCEDEGVSVVEAQEEEIRGRWDWHTRDGDASEASLETQADAELDAYRTLGLLERALNEL